MILKNIAAKDRKRNYKSEFSLGVPVCACALNDSFTFLASIELFSQSLTRVVYNQLPSFIDSSTREHIRELNIHIHSFIDNRSLSLCFTPVKLIIELGH